MNTLFIRYLLLFALLFGYYGCNPSAVNNGKGSNFFDIIKKYNATHFVGIGSGAGNNEETSLKIAKARALGELADNVKVTIMSKIEISTSEDKVNEKVVLSESIKEKIISIGDATVRLPAFEILNVLQTENGYKVTVLAKKLKKEHIIESAKDLDFVDDISSLIGILN